MHRFVLPVAILALVMMFAHADAQESQRFLITWRADAYAPPEFVGKTLPTARSTITASFEFVDRGALVNLSRQTVYWYVNNERIANGAGLQRVRFSAPDARGGTIDLRVELPGYRGAPLATIEIPIARSEVVIQAPFPEGFFDSSQISLVGKPYFFNVLSPADLNFLWRVNDEPPQTSEEPDTLIVRINPDAPARATLDVGLVIQNPIAIFETASKNLALTFSP